MKIRSFEWDIENKNHISYHNVDIFEVEEVFRNKPYYRRGKFNRSYAFGVTHSGRYLFIVFEKKTK